MHGASTSLSAADALASTAVVQAQVQAELARLHTTLSFASPSSHLYHDASTTTARPPAGTRLNPRSFLNPVNVQNILQKRFEPGMNRLGRAIEVKPFGSTTRAIVAGGGLDAESVLAVPADAEQRALAARLAAQPPDPELAGTLAHESEHCLSAVL